MVVSRLQRVCLLHADALGSDPERKVMTRPQVEALVAQCEYELSRTEPASTDPRDRALAAAWTNNLVLCEIYLMLEYMRDK